MGQACAGGEMASKEDVAKSRAIDQVLKKDGKVFTNEVKLLLLGAGESGKSTIAKQMKIIYLKGFSEQERRPFREIVYSNVIMSMRALVLAVEKFGLDLSDENKDRGRMFKSNTILFEQTLTPEISDAVLHLWSDAAVQEAYGKRSEYQLTDSAEYFFSQLSTVTDPNYLPSEQDILHCRARTTGITEISFPVLDVMFRMLDVGGQRSERKKWIHCFQDVTGLIFCVALSEYDLMLYEDESVNRMHESIMLFDEICNCQWFAETAIILFLNKSDLFKQKIKTIDLNVCFPDYTGGCDYAKAATYVSEKFAGLNRNSAKQIYAHVTCATDTTNVKYVFDVVKEVVQRMSLQRSGGLI
jgi:guanine nucleotide-binding protein G(i) subunit alpha